MPTMFIALQCCQCNTMQVKQQKKSSNKWTCVVCNQKQSVGKVYAQGFMAKDVRKFVQSFNMSRQLAEQNPLLEDDHKETLEIKDQFPINGKQRRTDWSEYIDPEEEDLKSHDIDENFGDGFGSKIVTEMPKAVFKKPKLKNYPSASNTGADGEKPFSPAFPKSNAEVKNTTQDQDKFEKKVLWSNQSAVAKSGSKWSCYITEESDDLQNASGRDLKTQDDPFEHDNDQRVEEDIHPDFL